MRALILVAMLLAACAGQSRHPADAFSGVNSRADFFARMTEYRESDYPKAVHDCAFREWESEMPQNFLDALDRFVADKSQANWDNLMRINNATVLPDAQSTVQTIVDKCKSA